MPGEHKDFSMGEVTTRAKLATRGLGYSWGIAEDAGRAITWLEQRSLPGLILLARLIQRIDERRGQVPAQGLIEAGLRPQSFGETLAAREGHLCPILTGIALSDAGWLESRQQKISAQNIMYALLLLPFASDVAESSKSFVELKSGNCQMITDGEQLWIASPPGLEPESLFNASDNLVISSKSAREAPSFKPWLQQCTRARVAATVWSALDQFARRTYAPATEESRIRGAGAGVSDSD